MTNPTTPPPPGQATVSKRRWLLRVGIAAASIGVLALAGRHYYGELHRLSRVSPAMLALLAAAYLITRLLLAGVLRASLASLGHSVRLIDAFWTLMVQFYTNMLIPRSGIGASAASLKASRGVPVADYSAAQVLTLTGLQFLATGIAGLAAVAWLSALEAVNAPWVVWAAFSAVAIAAALGTLVPIERLIPRHWQDRGMVARFVHRLGGSFRTLADRHGLIVAAIAVQLLIQMLRGWRLQLAYAAVGHPVSLAGAIASSALADLTFLISLTPAGLGFREAAIVYAGRLVGASGELAMSAAILDRLILTGCNLIFGQIGLWMLLRGKTQNVIPKHNPTP